MKKQIIIGLTMFLVGMAIVGIGYHPANASFDAHERLNIMPAGNQVTAPTPLPTNTPVVIGYPTPESRVLPPVGSNAGLVIGASVLVLIIIGGVLGARLRSKH